MVAPLATFPKASNLEVSGRRQALLWCRSRPLRECHKEVSGRIVTVGIPYQASMQADYGNPLVLADCLFLVRLKSTILRYGSYAPFRKSCS